MKEIITICASLKTEVISSTYYPVDTVDLYVLRYLDHYSLVIITDGNPKKPAYVCLSII